MCFIKTYRKYLFFKRCEIITTFFYENKRWLFVFIDLSQKESAFKWEGIQVHNRLFITKTPLIKWRETLSTLSGISANPPFPLSIAESPPPPRTSAGDCVSSNQQTDDDGDDWMLATAGNRIRCIGCDDGYWKWKSHSSNHISPVGCVEKMATAPIRGVPSALTVFRRRLRLSYNPSRGLRRHQSVKGPPSHVARATERDGSLSGRKSLRSILRNVLQRTSVTGVH